MWFCCTQTLRPDASLPYKEEFVKEARLMSQFDNEYIVKLLGVCIDRDPYYILIELMNQGDLVAFLRRSRPNKVPSLAIFCRRGFIDLVLLAVDIFQNYQS